MEALMDRVLGDRYQIKSLLGRQTGRRTFLARDLQTEASVVLKLLLFGPDFTWDDLKLFEREAEVLKSIDLPAIPKYLDCFDVETELGKGFVLVQTYIEAKSLQNWLDSGRTFSEGELISISKQLLAILDYLHHRQPAIIHRDIKPSNILLGDRSGSSPGQVYLVDFGSVRTVANGGSTITIVGTYGYMPPEQFGGKTIPASDLYALGATIVCLATGSHPSELPQKNLQIMFEDRVNLARHLVDWLKWMTTTSVDARIQSASEALTRLDLRPHLKKSSKRPKMSGNLKIKNTEDLFELTKNPERFSDKSWNAIIIFMIALYFFLVSGIVSAIIYAGVGEVMFILICSATFISLNWLFIYDSQVKQKLSINRSQILMSSEILGRYSSFSADRQDIKKIVFTPFYKLRSLIPGRYHDDIYPARLEILVGSRELILSHFGSTEEELKCLAYELAEWLNLPVTNRRFDSSQTSAIETSKLPQKGY
jgi:serine/threonine protein kinase